MARVSRKNTNFYMADFETTNREDGGVEVWLWGLTSRSGTLYRHGESLETFIATLFDLVVKTPLIYLHNLRFDGSFIIVWLLNNGYTYNDYITDDKQFNTVITDMGVFYEIQIADKGKIVKIHDSAKKIPLPVSDIPKAYNLDIEKLDMDYELDRSIDHEITDDELFYLENDLQIPLRALDLQYSQGLTRMTASSDAMADYKKRLGDTTFRKLFPVLNMDIHNFAKESYRGGYTHVKHSVLRVPRGKGVVYDVNSMYPAQMKNQLMPYDTPVYFKGSIRKELLHDYPLYIVKIRTDFIIKDNMLPTIQIKDDIRFVATEYITESHGEVILTLTNVDYDLFKEHYDTFFIEELEAYYFKGAKGMFDNYIDHWYAIKNNPDTPKGIVTISKLYLNGLYGKFGTNPENILKIPHLEDGVLRFTKKRMDDKETVYMPVASFVTSYARDLLIRSAQSLYPYFNYCDTDSIHLDNIPDDMEISDFIEIHHTELGAWDFEYSYDEATFFRAKVYKERNSEMEVMKCAGLKTSALQEAGYDKFEVGAVFENLKAKQVKGGVRLYIADFNFM